jgi:hypothetical protein
MVHQDTGSDSRKKNEERTVKQRVRLSTNVLRHTLRSFGFNLCVTYAKINIDQTVNSITMHLEMAIPIPSTLVGDTHHPLLFSPINYGEWIRKNGAAE